MASIEKGYFEGKMVFHRFKSLFGILLAVLLVTGCGQPGEDALPDGGHGIALQPTSIVQPTSGEQTGNTVPPNSGEQTGNTVPPISGEQPINTAQPTGGEQTANTMPQTGGEQSSAVLPEGEEQATDTISSPEITLVMVGDILLHTPVAESGKCADGSYDFSAVFAQMKEEIEGADLAIVNQEVIIGGAELGISGYPTFNAPYELGDALVDTGFDVVLHATNHTLDKGKRGVLNCLAFWQENYPEIAVLGIHGSEQEQEEIYVYEQDGIRIAILNYTYGTNGIALPSDMPYVVDLLEKNKVISDLQRAQELADFVIVCPHWGTEYTLKSTKEQENWAALFAENGADLVMGTHPHVIEPMAWIGSSGESEDAGSALVYYSLGNFVNWTSGTGPGTANRMVGGMARVTIGLGDEGEVVIKSYDVEPLVCHVEQGFGGVTVYPLAEYTEEMAARNEIVKQDSSFSLDYCRKLAEEVFGIE